MKFRDPWREGILPLGHPPSPCCPGFCLPKSPLGVFSLKSFPASKTHELPSPTVLPFFLPFAHLVLTPPTMRARIPAPPLYSWPYLEPAVITSSGSLSLVYCGTLSLSPQLLGLWSPGFPSVPPQSPLWSFFSPCPNSLSQGMSANLDCSPSTGPTPPQSCPSMHIAAINYLQAAFSQISSHARAISCTPVSLKIHLDIPLRCEQVVLSQPEPYKAFLLLLSRNFLLLTITMSYSFYLLNPPCRQLLICISSLSGDREPLCLPLMPPRGSLTHRLDYGNRRRVPMQAPHA